MGQCSSCCEQDKDYEIRLMVEEAYPYNPNKGINDDDDDDDNNIDNDRSGGTSNLNTGSNDTSNASSAAGSPSHDNDGKNVVGDTENNSIEPFSSNNNNNYNNYNNTPGSFLRVNSHSSDLDDSINNGNGNNNNQNSEFSKNHHHHGHHNKSQQRSNLNREALSKIVDFVAQDPQKNIPPVCRVILKFLSEDIASIDAATTSSSVGAGAGAASAMITGEGENDEDDDNNTNTQQQDFFGNEDDDEDEGNYPHSHNMNMHQLQQQEEEEDQEEEENVSPREDSIPGGGGDELKGNETTNNNMKKNSSNVNKKQARIVSPINSSILNRNYRGGNNLFSVFSSPPSMMGNHHRSGSSSSGGGNNNNSSGNSSLVPPSSPLNAASSSPFVFFTVFTDLNIESQKSYDRILCSVQIFRELIESTSTSSEKIIDGYVAPVLAACEMLLVQRSEAQLKIAGAELYAVLCRQLASAMGRGRFFVGTFHENSRSLISKKKNVILALRSMVSFGIGSPDVDALHSRYAAFISLSDSSNVLGAWFPFSLDVINTLLFVISQFFRGPPQPSLKAALLVQLYGSNNNYSNNNSNDYYLFGGGLTNNNNNMNSNVMASSSPSSNQNMINNSNFNNINIHHTRRSDRKHVAAIRQAAKEKEHQILRHTLRAACDQLLSDPPPIGSLTLDALLRDWSILRVMLHALASVASCTTMEDVPFIVDTVVDFLSHHHLWWSEKESISFYRNTTALNATTTAHSGSSESRHHSHHTSSHSSEDPHHHHHHGSDSGGNRSNISGRSPCSWIISRTVSHALQCRHELGVSYLEKVLEKLNFAQLHDRVGMLAAITEIVAVVPMTGNRPVVVAEAVSRCLHSAKPRQVSSSSSTTATTNTTTVSLEQLEYQQQQKSSNFQKTHHQDEQQQQQQQKEEEEEELDDEEAELREFILDRQQQRAAECVVMLATRAAAEHNFKALSGICDIILSELRWLFPSFPQQQNVNNINAFLNTSGSDFLQQQQQQQNPQTSSTQNSSRQNSQPTTPQMTANNTTVVTSNQAQISSSILKPLIVSPYLTSVSQHQQQNQNAAAATATPSPLGPLPSSAIPPTSSTFTPTMTMPTSADTCYILSSTPKASTYTIWMTLQRIAPLLRYLPTADRRRLNFIKKISFFFPLEPLAARVISLYLVGGGERGGSSSAGNSIAAKDPITTAIFRDIPSLSFQDLLLQKPTSTIPKEFSKQFYSVTDGSSTYHTFSASNSPTTTSIGKTTTNLTPKNNFNSSSNISSSTTVPCSETDAIVLENILSDPFMVRTPLGISTMLDLFKSYVMLAGWSRIQVAIHFIFAAQSRVEDEAREQLEHNEAPDEYSVKMSEFAGAWSFAALVGLNCLADALQLQNLSAYAQDLAKRRQETDNLMVNSVMSSLSSSSASSSSSRPRPQKSSNNINEGKEHNNNNNNNNNADSPDPHRYHHNNRNSSFSSSSPLVPACFHCPSLLRSNNNNNNKKSSSSSSSSLSLYNAGLFVVRGTEHEVLEDMTFTIAEVPSLINKETVAVYIVTGAPSKSIVDKVSKEIQKAHANLLTNRRNNNNKQANEHEHEHHPPLFLSADGQSVLDETSASVVQQLVETN